MKEDKPKKPVAKSMMKALRKTAEILEVIRLRFCKQHSKGAYGVYWPFFPFATEILRIFVVNTGEIVHRTHIDSLINDNWMPDKICKTQGYLLHPDPQRS